MSWLRDNTQFVIGIWSLGISVFECASAEAVDAILSKYPGSGITAHPGLAVYTREEWYNREQGYAKIGPGHSSYKEVQAIRGRGHFACDSVDHNTPEGCSNPECFKHSRKAQTNG